MRKEDSMKTRVCVQYDDHPRIMCTSLCSLMEHQSLVDLAIRCGNNTMHAHKCILAASSPYFREQLEKNPGTEQVIINGLDFVVMKSVIEFIYCGETCILEEHLKNVVAAAKLFQIRGLQALASETQFDSEDIPPIPTPIFINKKPKYSSPYVPYLPNQQDMKINPESDLRRLKNDEGIINETEDLPLHVVNFNELNNSILTTSGQIINFNKALPHNVIPIEVSTVGVEKTVDKIKDVFCQEMQTNVEIMYKTPEGEYVKVTDEVLRKITGDTLQFQVIDENGHEGEIQLLDDKIKMKSEDVWKQRKEKFPNPYREFINTPYPEESASETVDLDSILMNFQNHGKTQEEISKFDTIISDLSGESATNKSDINEIHNQIRNESVVDHSDILNEINSMQFYDKTVYDDVAERFESAFQRGNYENKENPVFMPSSDCTKENAMDKNNDINLVLDGMMEDDVKFF